MIDLHTHLLWDWDDGPDDLYQARAMARLAEKDGTTAICLTPHIFRMTRHQDDLGVLRRRMVEFRDEMRAAEIPVEFHYGAEVFVNPEVVRAVEQYRFTVDQTSYVFLEFAGEGVPVGVKVTLRRDRMYEFLDRLIAIGLPRVRDFRGTSPSAFDGRGNYTLGVRDILIFPEVDYQKVAGTMGMNITLTTTAKTDDHARALLTALGMPFQRR